MFTLQTRIADALAARPELRKLLPAFHPAFEKLNHPVLGRILPRLVTVEDAARVAGVDAAALLEVMNLPGAPAHPGPPAAPRAPEPEPAWLRGAAVQTLDVRPAIAAGEEPFPAIMAAIRGLPPGGVLRLLAPFEPAPLLRLLGGRGWRTHVAWDGETCQASFWMPPVQGEIEPQVAGDRLVKGPDGAVLDVRGLEPPEPLMRVLGALEDASNLPLTVVHHREPALLFPKLQERGLRWEITRDGDDVRIHIHGA